MGEKWGLRLIFLNGTGLLQTKNDEKVVESVQGSSIAGCKSRIQPSLAGHDDWVKPKRLTFILLWFDAPK